MHLIAQIHILPVRVFSFGSFLGLFAMKIREIFYILWKTSAKKNLSFFFLWHTFWYMQNKIKYAVRRYNERKWIIILLTLLQAQLEQEILLKIKMKMLNRLNAK